MLALFGGLFGKRMYVVYIKRGLLCIWCGSLGAAELGITHRSPQYTVILSIAPTFGCPSLFSFFEYGAFGMSPVFRRICSSSRGILQSRNEQQGRRLCSKHLVISDEAYLICCGLKHGYPPAQKLSKRESRNSNSVKNV